MNSVKKSRLPSMPNSQLEPSPKINPTPTLGCRVSRPLLESLRLVEVLKVRMLVLALVLVPRPELVMQPLETLLGTLLEEMLLGMPLLEMLLLGMLLLEMLVGMPLLGMLLLETLRQETLLEMPLLETLPLETPRLSTPSPSLPPPPPPLSLLSPDV